MIDVIGIDPGLTGAIAKYNGSRLATYELIPVKASSGRGKELPWATINDDYEFFCAGATDAFIEKVMAMNRAGEQKQGASGIFKFGYVAGALYLMVVCNGIREPILVPPQTWKAYFGLIGVGKTTKAKKEKAIAKAVELFPDNESDFFGPRGGGKDGVAEASLIAWYGYHQIKEQSL